MGGSESKDSDAYVLAELKECWADWRHYNSIIWQLPSVTVAIVGGLLGIAYTAIDELGPRTFVIFLAAFFAFVMLQALRKHRKFHDLRYEVIMDILHKKIDDKILDPIRGNLSQPPTFRAYRYLLASMGLLVFVTTFLGFWNLLNWIAG